MVQLYEQANTIYCALLLAGKTEKEANEFIESFYNNAYQEGFKSGNNQVKK